MKILFISSASIMAADLARRIQNEGHDVRLYIDDEDRKHNLDGMVKKTKDWKKDLDWVGVDGLIIFDDIGYGKIQDQLRMDGYTVFGGCGEADRLEEDREYAQKVFSDHGMKTVPIHNFETVADAISFVEKNPKCWVIKQNKDLPKNVNYVGHFADGRDILQVLHNYKRIYGRRKNVITLQEKIIGTEIGVGRFFNGNNWVGPMEINSEHKKMFPGDLGPTTSEMGTLAWYESNPEQNFLFNEVLKPFDAYLKKINFHGDFEINCISNEKGIFPLEATPRFGSPIIYLQIDFHESPFTDFLYALASGKSYDLKAKEGVGLVYLISVPPFPYAKKIDSISPRNLPVFFDMEVEEVLRSKNIHFEGVMIGNRSDGPSFTISDDQGYVVYVTSVASTFEDAKKRAFETISKIHIPKMFYRADIGDKSYPEIKNGILKGLVI